MCKKIYFLSLILSVCAVFSANANQCISYKIKPKITINIPNWTREIVQPSEPMDLLHGNVIATLENNYDIIADITPVTDGFCVGLKGVDATIGYTDFLIKIDNRHIPETCSYNVILDHENQHIDAYLSVIDDYKKEMYESLYSASDSIIPIFVRNESDIDDVVNVLNSKLQSHPDIVLIMQKIHAAEEIKNKSIDQHEDYSEIKKCIE